MKRYPSPFFLSPFRQRGFTLVEMIMVIVITGIIGGMVATFLQAPIQQYMDVARRADMTDVADTALRRVGRDLRLALPNSVRVTGACGGGDACFIEFLPTTGGGRYRAEAASVGASAGCGTLPIDVLDFSAADTCFEVLGPMPAVAAGDQIVVYNLGIPGADAYAGNNRSAVTAVAAPIITIAPFLYPFESPGQRFHVVTTPVTYACAPAAGGVGGTLTRWQGYPIQPAPPAALPAGGTSALLATNVSSCRFTYDQNVVAQRSGLVTMNLGITEEGEAVNLYSATHVSNQP
jgi:MSHA biogenesis protein MshO